VWIIAEAVDGLPNANDIFEYDASPLELEGYLVFRCTGDGLGGASLSVSEIPAAEPVASGLGYEHGAPERQV